MSALEKTNVIPVSKIPPVPSHPLEVIQFHIAIWLIVTIVLTLALMLYYFSVDFKRDDPILYSQLNVNSQQKNK